MSFPMPFYIRVVVALFFSVSMLLADSDLPRITGSLNDGSVDLYLVKEEVKVLPDYQVKRSHVIRGGKDGRQITRVYEVVPPVRAEVTTEVASDVVSEEVSHTGQLLVEDKVALMDSGVGSVSGVDVVNAAELPSAFMMVSATVFDGRYSYLQVWDQSHSGQSSEDASPTLTAWSNVDWSHLGGFSSFEDEGRSFAFLLMQSDAAWSSYPKWRHNQGADAKAIASALRELPSRPKSRSKAEARYVVIEGGDGVDSELALDFLEGIHELYELNEFRLVAATRGRVRERERKARELRLQALEEAVNPKERAIYFWFGEKSTKPEKMKVKTADGQSQVQEVEAALVTDH